MKKKWLWKLSLGILVFLFGSIFILAVVPAAFPAVGATLADLLRATFGPQPVAMLESASSHLHDTLSRHLYKGDAPQIQWSASTPLKQTPSLSQSNARGQLAPSSAAKSSVIVDAPQIGWQAYGPLVNGSYVLGSTLITPDSYRPYAGVALVR